MRLASTHTVPDAPDNIPLPASAVYGPREKLSDWGPHSLSDSEILAVLLGTGSRDRPVTALADHLLSLSGGLHRLCQRSVRELAVETGVGLGKASRVAAAAELGRRLSALPLTPGTPLRSSEDVYRAFGPLLAHVPHEELWVLALDARFRVMARTMVARGGIDACQVLPADVFRPLLREGAAGAILIHNHPSGEPAPSPEDLTLTEQLGRAGDLLGVSLVDHIIVAAGGYFSCLDAGVYPGPRRES